MSTGPSGAIILPPSNMKLQELFAPADLVVGLTPSDKWEAIRTLLAHLVSIGGVPPEREEELLEALFERERSMSTGMERGLAIPHAAVEGLDELQAVLGVIQTPAGLEFSSIDGSPARLVILLLIPKDKKLLHIRTLADIARGLGRGEVMDAVLAASGAEAAWQALGSEA